VALLLDVIYEALEEVKGHITMKHYMIFDNGGKTADRFTIIKAETGDVFGASEQPGEAGGIGRWCGNIIEHKIVLYGAGWRQRLPSKKIIEAEIENYVNNARLDPEWLGREIELESLPEAVQNYIADIKDEFDAGPPSKAKIATIGDFSRNTMVRRSN
jgi:hypothetical protein